MLPAITRLQKIHNNKIHKILHFTAKEIEKNTLKVIKSLIGICPKS